jgi:serine/threonine-protein kinase RsbW
LQPRVSGMSEGQNDRTNQLETLLESTLDSVDAAEAVVLKAAEEVGFTEDDLHEIGMAVREAMVNAVVHGNRYNFNKKVHLNVAKQPNGLQVRITDEGAGFDQSHVPDPLQEENLLRQSGRGLLLMQAFVDEFEMHHVPPLGTEVKMVKYRKPS